MSGLIPSDKWKQDTWGESWLTGDTYNMAIGQGFVLATPLQVANVTNAIANGGRLLRPHVVAAIRDAEDNILHEVEPTEIRQLPLGPVNLGLVHEAMKRVP